YGRRRVPIRFLRLVVEQQATWPPRDCIHLSRPLTEEAFAVIRSRSGRTVANRLLIGALALLIPAIAGCEAGFNAPTLEFHPASAGVNATVNGIKINNVFVLSAPSGSSVPAGASAGMVLALFTGGASHETPRGPP